MLIDVLDDYRLDVISGYRGLLDEHNGLRGKPLGQYSRRLPASAGTHDGQNQEHRPTPPQNGDAVLSRQLSHCHRSPTSSSLSIPSGASLSTKSPRRIVRSADSGQNAGILLAGSLSRSKA